MQLNKGSGMSSNEDDCTAVSKLDDWYLRHCDGTWEHHYGIKIETTDNPGWLVTFDELMISQRALSDVIGELLLKQNVQVTTDGVMVRLFGKALHECLAATTILIDISDQ